jgi:hypothetical protein
MTDRIDEISALLAGATGGPWLRSGEWIIRAEDDAKDGTDVVPVVGLWDGGDLRLKADDARLVAAAPELLAWAAGEIERLRRFRDAVVALAVNAPDGTPWWYMQTTLGNGCSQCASASTASRDWPEPSEVVHVGGCAAVIIDALAKEVST